MITSKQAARIRHKVRAGLKVSEKTLAALAEYDSSRGRPPTQNVAPEASGEPVEAASAPPPTPEAPPPIAAPEAPPPIKLDTPASSSASSGPAWQDKYRKQMAIAGMDGREAICVFIGSQWVSALEAMEADLALVDIKPVIPAKALFPVIVIALDQILPDKARLTPPLAAAIGSTTTAIQRFKHHKKIVEVQKKDPSIQEYKRKLAEEEAKARAERVAKAAEAGIKSVPPVESSPSSPPPVMTAEPPPSPAPSIDHTPSSRPAASELDLGPGRMAPGIGLDGRPVI